MSQLPSGWVEATVGELATSFTDGPFGSNLKTEHYTGAGARVIRLQNIADGWFNDADHAFISIDRFTRLQRHDARPGDILIAAMGDVLPRVCLVPDGIGPAIVKADCFRLRPSHAVNARYLAFMLSSPQVRHQAAPMVAGIGRPRLNLSKVAALRLPLAPVAEQERIVAAIEEELSRIDAGMTALKSARRRLEQLREALPSTVGNEATTWTTLGDIADVVGGVTKDTKKQTDPSFIEVPYLRVANVQRGYLDLREITTIRVPPERAKALTLQAGDILFNEGGDRDKLGRGWVWAGQIEGCIHQNHVFRARLTVSDYDPRFISIHGNTFGRRWFEEHGKQTTNLASLNLTTLKSFPVPVMSVEDQRKIAATFTEQQADIARLEKALWSAGSRAVHFRASLLGMALSGQLVAQNPEDEPASVLLERLVGNTTSSNGRVKTRVGAKSRARVPA